MTVMTPRTSLAPDATQHAVLLRRAGAVAGTGVWYGPGSAQQRFTLHRVRDK